VKNILTLALATFLTFILNFGLFLFVYRKLVFPYLEEAERMDNAPWIFTYVLFGFFGAAVISSLISRHILKS
jgi:hypothetical protein